jgi:hypothetical protein
MARLLSGNVVLDTDWHPLDGVDPPPYVPTMLAECAVGSASIDRCGCVFEGNCFVETRFIPSTATFEMSGQIERFVTHYDHTTVLRNDVLDSSEVALSVFNNLQTSSTAESRI